MRFLLVFLMSFNLFGSPILSELRINFPNIESKADAENFINKLENKTSAEEQGYLAAMYFFKSKYVKFPTTKFKYFKKGKELLDTLIKTHPNNFELRYIRFIFQHQIPKFLGYNSSKNEDFKVIIKSNFLNKHHIKILLKLDGISDKHKQKILQIV